MKESLYWWFRVVITPSCWIQNYPYNSTFDRILIGLSKTHQFVGITPYYAQLGHVTLWVANYPYACLVYNNMRPSRKTILKLYDKYLEDILCPS